MESIFAQPTISTEIRGFLSREDELQLSSVNETVRALLFSNILEASIVPMRQKKLPPSLDCHLASARFTLRDWINWQTDDPLPEWSACLQDRTFQPHTIHIGSLTLTSPEQYLLLRLSSLRTLRLEERVDLELRDDLSAPPPQSRVENLEIGSARQDSTQGYADFLRMCSGSLRTLDIWNCYWNDWDPVPSQKQGS